MRTVERRLAAEHRDPRGQRRAVARRDASGRPFAATMSGTAPAIAAGRAASPA